MNWSQQDLVEFVERWKAMKEGAETGDVGAQKLYEKKLKSLGFNAETTGGRIKADRDQKYGLSEDGATNRAPAQWDDKYRSAIMRLNKADRQ